MRKLILGFTAVLCLALPSMASARYNVPQHQAERYAEQKAGELYGDFGIEYATNAAWCYPQGHYQDRNFIPGFYHRWVCGWAGPDVEGDDASGVLLIIGGSGYYDFRYKVLRGIHWV